MVFFLFLRFFFVCVLVVFFFLFLFACCSLSAAIATKVGNVGSLLLDYPSFCLQVLRPSRVPCTYVRNGQQPPPFSSRFSACTFLTLFPVAFNLVPFFLP